MAGNVRDTPSKKWVAKLSEQRSANGDGYAPGLYVLSLIQTLPSLISPCNCTNCLSGVCVATHAHTSPCCWRSLPIKVVNFSFTVSKVPASTVTFSITTGSASSHQFFSDV